MVFEDIILVPRFSTGVLTWNLVHGFGFHGFYWYWHCFPIDNDEVGVDARLLPTSKPTRIDNDGDFKHTPHFFYAL